MKNAKSVNQYLADLALWNIKLHNLHFNVESKPYAVKETLEILLGDLELMRDEALKIREEADKEDNFLLANMMEDHVEFYALKIWFTRAFLTK